MKIQLLLAFTCVTFVSACAGDKLQQKSVDANSLSHADIIQSIESGLRPTYGTTDEAVPTWTLKDRMEHYGVPALSVAVAIDGDLVWAKAYGEIEKGSGKSVDTDTLFQAASLSKPIASLTALSLVDRGLVSLDRPANDYLSSWKFPDNEFTKKTNVTLRHLLSHRAGTTIHGFRGYKQEDQIPSLVQILDGQAPANTKPVIVTGEPGIAYKYSGGGFTAVQLLIEDVSGMSYADIVNQEIFEPLKLTRSNFAYPQPETNSAVGHTGKASISIPQPGYIYPELAAAGLWSTPSDLVRLGSQVAKARGAESNFLSKAIVNQLVPQSADEAGLGFGLNNAGDGVAFVHNGHNLGYSARWINYADGRASVAILTNADTGGDLIREVLSSIGYAYGWKQDGYVERKTVDLPLDWTESVVGNYAFDALNSDPVAKITLESGKLWLSGVIAERSRFYAATQTEFFIGKGMNFEIETNANGEPVALNVEGEIRLIKSENWSE